ncbi:hypothetical protein GCM10023169_27420 [Georgenia halophila]|uniref:Leucine rich repeat variant domain-containing protein n=1 Tax=Georgenia halophila TaxID=620889 RepID=A0ABP8LFJ9_9MICO
MTGADGNAGQPDLAAQAADPSTPLATLQTLAQHHPELRAAIAENPATYPGLLEWLGRLGMPDVDAALARRAEAGQAVQAPPPPPEAEPGAEPEPDLGQTPPVVEPSAGPPTEAIEPPTEAEPPARAADRGEPSADGSQPVERRSILGRGEQAEAGAGAGAWGATQMPPARPPQTPPTQPTQPTRPAQWQPTHQPAEPSWEPPSESGALFGAAARDEHEDARRRSWVPLALLAVLAAILVIIVIIQLTGGEDEPEPPAPTGEQTQDQADEPEQTGQGETTDVEAAREQLTSLPESTSCEDPSSDAGTFGTFAAAAAPDGTWAQESDSQLVIDTLQGLQQSCSNVYAVSVAGALTEGEGTPEVLASTVSEAGTDWVDFARPAPDGATEISTFASPSGNIQCDLGGDLARCTILEHNFDAPQGCDDGTTLAVPMDGEVSNRCDSPVGAQGDVLQYGDSGVSDFYACTSEETGMTCWNTLTGHGFSMARAGYETF